jgi:hypothetical protein
VRVTSRPETAAGAAGVEVSAELIYEAPDLLYVDLIRAPEGVEDLGLNAALRIPLACDELEVAGIRAALAWGDDLAEVHVQQDRSKQSAKSSSPGNPCTT